MSWLSRNQQAQVPFRWVVWVSLAVGATGCDNPFAADSRASMLDSIVISPAHFTVPVNSSVMLESVQFPSKFVNPPKGPCSEWWSTTDSTVVALAPTCAPVYAEVFTRRPGSANVVLTLGQAEAVTANWVDEPQTVSGGAVVAAVGDVRVAAAEVLPGQAAVVCCPVGHIGRVVGGVD